jgi:hypothetical protein
MRAWSLIIFFLSLNFAGIIISYLIGGDVIVGSDSVVMPYSTDQILSQFTLTTFAISAVGGGIAGLIGLITKQYVFAAGAAVIWILGIFFTLGNWILNGFQLMLNILLAGTGLDFLGTILYAFFLVFFFFFLAGTISQNPNLTS